jgi:DNA-directed RNA polymerase subunit RPC12/RpoP
VVYDKEYRYVCLRCGKGGDHKNNMKKHYQTNHKDADPVEFYAESEKKKEENKFACPYCGKTFPQITGASRHSKNCNEREKTQTND